MKIKRKAAKPARAGVPLFLIGCSAPADAQALKAWFDRDYGGPLTLKPTTPQPASSPPLVLAGHGPWTVPVSLSLTATEAEHWRDRLQWSHPHAAAVYRPALAPGQAFDTVLHAARLTRGLTLLTQGTAYDVVTETYLNPSDWLDRSLVQFVFDDHVRAVQAEAPEPTLDWFSTRGLSKFGLEELEVFQPIGLPARHATERLLTIAEEVLRQGRAPTVGSRLHVPELHLDVRVVRHRTVPSADTMVILREITWAEAD
ncbi:hypothetical protein [Candidatus Nitrospira bockiana]